jgi:hypothetical protein
MKPRRSVLVVSLHPLQRRVGEIMLGIGLVHTLVGAMPYARAVRASMDRGWPGFISTQPNADDLHAEWFTVGGLAMLLLASTTRTQVRQTGTAPHVIGWGLVGVTVLCVAVEPRTGAWSLLLPAGIILSMPESNRATRPV